MFTSKMMHRLFASSLILTLAVGILPLAAQATDLAKSRVTLHVRNANLQDVLSLIAQQSGMNIVLDGAPPSNGITIDLNNVPLRTALDAIEATGNLADAWQNNVLHIGDEQNIIRNYPTNGNTSIVENIYHVTSGDLDSITRSIQGVVPVGTIVLSDNRTGTIYVKGTRQAIGSASSIFRQLDQSRFNGGYYQTTAITLRNIKASDALSILKTELPVAVGQSLAASDHPNTILVTGSPDFLATAKGMLGNIDIPGLQVRFDVRVTDITPINDSSNIGVLFGGVDVTGKQIAGSGSTVTTFLNHTLPINATISALQSTGQASILAEPSIAALNNEKAVLNIGEQYPITYFNPQTGQNQVQFINAGVDLTMTPIIGNNGDVTITLDTDYSQILSFVNSYPIVGQRHVSSVLRVGNDQTIVIAGLFEDVSDDTVQKVPFLGDIPIIGQIFRNRVKSHKRDEIVFLITPHIIVPADYHAGTTPPELQNQH